MTHVLRGDPDFVNIDPEGVSFTFVFAVCIVIVEPLCWHTTALFFFFFRAGVVFFFFLGVFFVPFFDPPPKKLPNDD